MTVETATHNLEHALKNKGIDLIFYKQAVTSTSIYFKFEHPRLGSLTVRDHNGLRKYSYRWNLQKGWKGPRKVIRNGIENFFYGFNEIKQMAEDIEQFSSNLIDAFDEFDII